MVLKEYFTDKELNCNCGCGLLPPYESLERLYLLRLLCGFPLYINSAARCKNYNSKVGGKDGSTHLPEWDRTGFLRGKGGCGFDIRNDRKIDFQKRQIIVEKAIFCGFKGLGFADTFIHIDDAKRDKLTEWWY